MTDLQLRETVGEHRRVSCFFISEFLTGSRMCLVEVERSPKPVASWYFTSFWSSSFVIFGPQCDARDARLEGFHEHTFGPRSKVAVPSLDFRMFPDDYYFVSKRGRHGIPSCQPSSRLSDL